MIYERSIAKIGNTIDTQCRNDFWVETSSSQLHPSQFVLCDIRFEIYVTMHSISV